MLGKFSTKSVLYPILRYRKEQLDQQPALIYQDGLEDS